MKLVVLDSQMINGKSAIYINQKIEAFPDERVD